MKRPKRVLFVCIGNSCRSQMAEAFARTYGGRVIEPASAGIYPACIVAPDTVRAMAEKGIQLAGHFPKNLSQMNLARFDMLVDMSGGLLEREPGIPVEVWDVPDPVVMEYPDHCRVRDLVEQLVQNLIYQLRPRKQRARVFGIGF